MAKSGAKTRDILLIGVHDNAHAVQKSLSHHLDFAFRELPGSPFNWQFIHLDNPKDLPNQISQMEVPLLVYCDTKHDSASKAWDLAFAGLRKLDPSCCILIQTPVESPPAEIVIGWLDRGTNGLFNLKAPIESTEDSLRDMLSKPLKVKVPRKVRMNSRHLIELQLASLEQALVSETLNIGLGGLFIRSAPQGVQVGDEVEFVLQFSKSVSDKAAPENSDPLVLKINDESSSNAKEPKNKEIRGTGSVVWVRNSPAPEAPEGVGLQFLEVEPEGFKLLQEFIANHRIKAFIPKA